MDTIQIIDTQIKYRPLLPNAQYCFRKLSERSGMLPSSLFIDEVQRIGQHPVSGGGSSDIWKGTQYTVPIAILQLREAQKASTAAVWSLSRCSGFSVPTCSGHRRYMLPINISRTDVKQEFCREALAWRQLHHQNVAPFYGVSLGPFAPHMCMVSPWMVCCVHYSPSSSLSHMMRESRPTGTSWII